jgi:hypothetical protein
MARPPLSDEQVRSKVVAYCERYGVAFDLETGLPPFPSGRRETPQHREWLTVYRALQRLGRRAAAVDAAREAAAAPSVSCPVCSRSLERDLAVPYARRSGTSSRPASLHPSCAELARLAEALGQDAVSGLAPFLWPRRTRAARRR